MSKTFDGASRADAQSISPMKLRIVGGLALPEDERGPLDTAPDPNSPFHAHDLLRPLDPHDVDDVYDQGVIAPIEVVRVSNIPTVNWGRGRVRKARLANIRRAANGLPLIEIKFIVVRISNDLQQLKRAHAENLRRKTFNLLDQIALAKQLLLHGASEEAAAREIGIPFTKFKQVLAFEDHATPTMKLALQQGRVSPSAGFVLAGITDPAEQDARLAELLTAPKPTVRAARSILVPNEIPHPRRPQQRKLLTVVEKHSKGDAWLQGAKAALKWVIDGEIHKDLSKLIIESEEPAKKKA